MNHLLLLLVLFLLFLNYVSKTRSIVFSCNNFVFLFLFFLHSLLFRSFFSVSDLVLWISIVPDLMCVYVCYVFFFFLFSWFVNISNERKACSTKFFCQMGLLVKVCQQNVIWLARTNQQKQKKKKQLNE